MSGENSSPHPQAIEQENQSDFFKELFKNPIINRLPKHLKQFIVDQNYVAYSPQDHSVWRYVLRQNHRYLIEHAHEIYFEGLEKTGLKIEGVPSISEMNKILTKIDWAAVSVDGFIPPAAFMEFQAHKVLVIAADMRQIQHIEYTPSPDIIHEAAGHAPVIADSEYAEYLRLFGEVGSKAMSSKKDYELYEAIRKLSILKEARDADKDEIDKAEKDVLFKQENLGKPSEMALLTRLHWWTVEYGLIGTLEKPKIYGAGILSSIGEASSCLSPKIKKIPYDINAANYAFDITTMQPHLFVTPDFKNLIDVLMEFSETMAYKVGGIEGINKAIECERTSTCVYSSGLQVSGTFTDVITDSSNNPIYLKVTGEANLAIENKELPGHGIDYHKDGFSSPIGKLNDCTKAFEDFTENDLKENSIALNSDVEFEFQSGIKVSGYLTNIVKHNNKFILLTFKDCHVTYKDQTLFDPSWGNYDMAVGNKIISVFAGAADKDAYQQPPTVSKTRVIKYTYDDKSRYLHSLYQKIRDYRNDNSVDIDLRDIWRELKDKYPDEWLLEIEMLELLYQKISDDELLNQIKSDLLSKAEKSEELKKIIDDGIYLAENFNEFKHTKL